MSSRQNQLGRIERKLDKLAVDLDKSNFRDYIEYIHDRKRLFYNSFIAGVARGLGSAVGFALMGALILYFLRILAQSSIPYLADFISEIIKIVESKK